MALLRLHLEVPLETMMMKVRQKFLTGQQKVLQLLEEDFQIQEGLFQIQETFQIHDILYQILEMSGAHFKEECARPQAQP